MNRYFIIEKDTSVIESIRNVFDEKQNFQFIGSSDSFTDAMNLMLKEAPSLIILNIDNTIDDPFKLISEVNLYLEVQPLTIAISHSKEQAYKVIKSNFFDYLLKPLTELELRKAMLKVKKQISIPSRSTVCLKSYRDYQYLDTNEILFLKADNNSTDFHMKDGSVISAFKTLKTFENTLPDHFLRIHKSYIINARYVSRINYGKLMCTINRFSNHIPFTKSYLSNVESINKTLSDSSLFSSN